jgi:ribosomal-protein-serine acetyltransferase
MEIRLPTPDEAPALFALVDGNRARLRQWLHWLDDHASLDDTRRHIDHFVRLYEVREAFHLAVFDDGVICGMVSLQNVDWLNRKASVGYWLGEAWLGRGLMTKVCGTLIDFAFDELDLNRLEIHCAVANHRSKRIPQHFGFTLEGVMREAEWLYDHWVDHDMYALLARDYKRARSTTG